MQQVGFSQESVTAYLTEGDALAFTVSMQGQALPAPVTLWIGGQEWTGQINEDGTVASFALTPEEVTQIVTVGAQQGQIDLGTARTLWVHIVRLITPHPVR